MELIIKALSRVFWRRHGDPGLGLGLGLGAGGSGTPAATYYLLIAGTDKLLISGTDKILIQ